MIQFHIKCISHSAPRGYLFFFVVRFFSSHNLSTEAASALSEWIIENVHQWLPNEDLFIKV